MAGADVTDRRSSGAIGPEGAGSRHAQLGPPTGLLRLLSAALLTSAVTLYNHFPLTYPDTGNYLQNAIAIAHGRAPWFFYRPLVYGMFLVPFASPQTIWLVPVAQGLLVAVLVDLSLRTAAVPLSIRGFVTLFAGLSAFTSLSWFSGQIMPDIFTSFVILLCFVSVWGDERQTARERWAAGALSAFAIGCHLFHFPLYGMLVVALLAGRLVVDRSSRSWRRFAPLALRVIAPLVVAAGLLIGSNYYFRREPVLSGSSPLFALAHLVGEGLAQRYLDRACPTQQYLLCSERASLQPDLDWFLWASDGTWKRHEAELERGDSTFLREASAIVAGTWRQEWPAAVSASLRNTIVQLRTIGHDEGELAFSTSVEEALARLDPGTVRAYRHSRQVQKSLPIEAASRVQYAAVGLGLLVLLGCLPALRGRMLAPLRALIATVCLGVVLNAFVMASLATVHPRYQSRVVWLVPLIGAVAAVAAVGARAHRGSVQSTAQRVDLG
jgi:hypothetical protein